MLSNENIREINRQIRAELRNAQSFTATPEQKLAALDRVAKLKAILDSPVDEPLPSRKTLLKELATAILEARTEHQRSQEPRDLFEAIFGTRR